MLSVYIQQAKTLHTDSFDALSTVQQQSSEYCQVMHANTHSRICMDCKLQVHQPLPEIPTKVYPAPVLLSTNMHQH